MNSPQKAVWNIRDHNAVGDGRTNDRDAVQQTIDACHRAGGGTVLLPAGDYLSGTLYLKDHVTLSLQAGATLRGSPRREEYPVPHLIYAKDARNVSIVGPGTIDGQSEAFWIRDGDRWRRGEFRPSPLLQFAGCRDVLIRDLMLTNAPGWTIHLFRCDTVNIRGVTIRNDMFGPNTDGIDPNSSTNVHIADCHIVAGDDCIVLKATESYPCENITVTNCTLETTCTALKLGTESHGDIRHCFFSNCTIRNTRTGIGLYMKDGGTMEAIIFANITMELKAGRPSHTEWPIFMDIERRGEESRAGIIRDILFHNIIIRGRGRCLIQGMKTQPIERLTLDNLTLITTGYEDLSGAKKVRGGRTSWDDPEAGTHAGAPANLIFANVNGLRLRNVQLGTDTGETPQERSALFGDNLRAVEIDGFHARTAVQAGSSPVLHLRDCREVLVRGCQAAEGTGTFLQLEGPRTGGISLLANDLSKAANPVACAENVDGHAVYEQANRMPGS